MSDFPREQQIVLTFYGDRETAERLKDAMHTTVMALTNPTHEHARALFYLGAEAIAAAADAERAA